MLYLITQLLLLLAIASLLSAAIGWLCRRFFTEQAHQDQISDYKRAGRRHLAEIDDLRRELTDRNTQVAGLNSKLHYNQEAMDAADAERSALLRDIDELHAIENQLRAVEDDRARLDQQLNDAENELEHTRRAQTDNDAALQQALAEKEQQLLAASAAAADKQQQLAATHDAKANTEQQLSDAIKDRAKREDELRAAAVSAAENEEKLKAAANVNKNLEDIIASLNEDIKAKTAEREKAAQQQAVLTADLGRLEHKFAQAEQAHAARTNDLEKSLRSEKDALAAAKQTIAAGEEKLNSVNALLAERNQERDKLEQQCSAQKQEIAALQREIAKAQKSAADAQIAAQKSIADLEHKLDKQKNVTAQADKQAASEAQAKGQLQKELDRLHGDLRNANAHSKSQEAAAASLLEQQKLAAADSQSAASAAEQQLAQLKREHADLKKAADSRLNDLHQSKTEAAKFAEKIAAAEAKIADLEARMSQQAKNGDSTEQQLRDDLNKQANAYSAQQAELRDAVNQALELQNTVADYQSNEVELRAMIEKLQQLLSDERKMAGTSLLTRIRELEAMLDAERRKADELHVIGDVGNVTLSKSSVRTNAANASTVKKTGTGKD